MRTRSLTALGVVLGALCLGLHPADAQAQRHERRGPGGLATRHADRLGLDAATLESIDRIVEESGARDEAIRKEMRSARERMRRLLDEPTPDPASVLAQAEKLGELETREQKNRLEAILKIRRMLSPGQLQELLRIREEEQPGRRGRGVERRCGEVLDRLCPDARDGPRVLECLRTHWASLGERCQRSFQR